ncbi:response regulator [Erysipelothrix sp. D19-032]
MYRVCIIEDEAIIRKGLRRAIDWDTLKCAVVGEAANGNEGYRLIEKEKPDIIVLDINMPIMDGIALLELLPRETYSVIIISGHSEFDYAKKAIEFGVTEYLLKPLDHVALTHEAFNVQSVKSICVGLMRKVRRRSSISIVFYNKHQLLHPSQL